MDASKSNIKEFHRVLKAVQKRPGMFISPINLSSLCNFISGYNSFNLFNSEHADTLDDEMSLFEWIAIQENTILTPRRGWVDVLESRQDLTPEQRLALFFKYLDEYVEHCSGQVFSDTF